MCGCQRRRLRTIEGRLDHLCTLAHGSLARLGRGVGPALGILRDCGVPLGADAGWRPRIAKTSGERGSSGSKIHRSGAGGIQVPPRPSGTSLGPETPLFRTFRSRMRRVGSPLSPYPAFPAQP